MKKIHAGKQEKPFHEIILQIGDRETMGAETEEGRLAERYWMNICRISREEILH